MYIGDEPQHKAFHLLFKQIYWIAIISHVQYAIRQVRDFYQAKKFGMTTPDTPDPGLTEIDKKVSENTMAIWAQFARTGNPSIDGLVNWPAYDSETDQYLYIGESLEVKSGFSKIAQEK
jgi:hypothetical protein